MKLEMDEDKIMNMRSKVQEYYNSNCHVRYLKRILKKLFFKMVNRLFVVMITVVLKK